YNRYRYNSLCFYGRITVRNSIGTIAGSIVGGVVFLIVMITVIVILVRRRRYAYAYQAPVTYTVQQPPVYT
ncbi:hypothetical protein HDU67_002944, partial [Dinochytrium kinnereticum]